MNAYAVVMQSSGMSAMSQWLVIGLSLVCLAAAVTLSGTPTKQTRTLTRIGVALLVALVLATLAAMPLYAATIIECKNGVEWYWWLIWGC